MKLSDLVDLRNKLCDYSRAQINTALRESLYPAIHAAQDHPAAQTDQDQRLQDLYVDLVHQGHLFTQALDDYVHRLDQEIQDLEMTYMADSYRLYDQLMRREQPDYILDRRLTLNSDAAEVWQARLIKHSDWKYPGLVLRPGREDWISSIVALDPLYLIDLHHDLLIPARQRFNPQYQGRLRFLTVDESQEQSLLESVPQGQLGLVVAFNFFNYRPFEMLQRYLTEIYHCLRPGGVLIMTYNNCDRAGAVSLVERGFTCYTPQRLVEAFMTNVGYDIVFRYDLDAAVTMLEARRPGELTSLRGGQTLAEILP